MYFISSKIEENALDHHRMLAYLLVSLETVLNFVKSTSTLVYIYLINIGQASLKLDEYDYAKKTFHFAYRNFSKLNPRNSSVIILFLYYQTEDYDSYINFRN
jgi:hypothetical protein